MPIGPQKSMYRQVADLLRDEINDGTYLPGSALPSEPELAERFDVSRVTVNHAVRLLRSEGIVRVRRGSGTYVRDVPRIPRDMVTRYRRAIRETGGARGAFQAELEHLGLVSRSDLVQVGPIEPTPDVAEILQLTPDERALIRKRHMFANDTPVLLATSFVPWAIARGTQLEQADTGTGGMYSRLDDLGVGPAHFTDAIEVRSPSDEQAAFLGLEDGQQIVHVTHIAWTREKQPIELRYDALPAHQWTLHYEWTVE